MPTLAVPFWIFLTVAAFCVVFVGIDKAGLGSGLGVLATPLMSLVVPPSVAIGILLPVLCACDLFALWHYRRCFDRRNLKLMTPGALLGVAVASLFFALMRDRASLEQFLRLLIGGSVLLFVIHQWLPKGKGSGAAGRRPRPLPAGAAGLVSGFTSTLAHAGGPPVTMFLLPQGMDRHLFVGTTVWFFTITNYVKLIPYGWFGLIDGGNLKYSLMLMPLAPVGIMAGVWLNRRIDPRLFRNVVLTVLLLTALQFLSGRSVTDLLALFGKG